MRKLPSDAALAGLIDPLRSDIRRCHRLMRDDPRSQFARRAYVRSVAAFTEAWLAAAKDVMHRAIALLGGNEADLAVISGVAYEVDDRGRAYVVHMPLSLEKNIRFTFRLLHDALQHAGELTVFGDAGWESFRRMVGIRNRLMHPKKAADLRVTDEEVSASAAALTWFNASRNHLLGKRLRRRLPPSRRAAADRRKPARGTNARRQNG